MSNAQQAVRERLRQLRDDVWQGNQSTMAKAVGIPQGTLSNILKGSRNAGPRIISTICKTAGVSSEWLRFGDGAPFIEDSPLNDGRTRIRSSNSMTLLRRSLLDIILQKLEEIEPLRRELKRRAMIFQCEWKEAQAMAEGKPFDTYHNLSYADWSKIRDSRYG